MTFSFEPIIADNITGELANVATSCKLYGLICTPYQEYQKFTVWIAVFGMIVGVICMWLFQYTRRKMAEKEQEEEYEDNK
jgi:predicted histidine transporter YuiF (NhaC family)